MEENYYGRRKNTFAYRLEVVRNEGDLAPEALRDTALFSGYYVKLPNPSRARFLTLAKADVLKNNPLVTNDGAYPIRVYFVDENSKDEKLIYDSGGTTKEIMENWQSEGMQYGYCGYLDNWEIIEDENGNKYCQIKTNFKINRLPQPFFYPLKEDEINAEIHYDPSVKSVRSNGFGFELNGIKRIYKYHGLITTLL